MPVWSLADHPKTFLLENCSKPLAENYVIICKEYSEAW